ncbi:hypothetical protein ABZ752_22625 [Streptomyces roseifaciens]
MTANLDALRRTADKSAKKAQDDRDALLTAAVAEAVTSDAYGHLSAVAKRAGITSQYLRTLVEEEHPGWLTEAAAKRAARKSAGQ